MKNRSYKPFYVRKDKISQSVNILRKNVKIRTWNISAFLLALINDILYV